ncbi:hypothetical protein BDV11DRAFT_169231 [Aspergillus similis]
MASSASQARSRRSYPSLNRISLAPLTPHYPIDDDDNEPGKDPQDYFTPRNDAVDIPTRTSYLSSYSVPGTPGVLSRAPSRSGSRARHHTRSKSSTPIHFSDSNLQEQNVNQPLHHQSRDSASGNVSTSFDASRRTRHSTAHRHQLSEVRDPEWMLRAGAALASTAREEKGQSWLAKRESSTSLVSEAGRYEVDAISHALRTGISRRSKSGRSTPAAAHSRSRAASRRNSRPDLSMTGLEMSTPSPTSKRSSVHIASAPRTPSHVPSEDARSTTSLLPDFIDEHVRAEMRDTIQQHVVDDYDSATSYDSEEREEDMDERELQRLTRERGFGLGNWIDRLVEWTLFGVDDWPLFTTSDATTEPQGAELHADQENNRGSHELSDKDDDETRSQISDTNSDIPRLERAGDHGGWEDAGWFFRTLKQALTST